MTTPQLRYHVLDTGYCLVSERFALRGGGRHKLAFHALVILLQHPRHGRLLLDTGYAPRMLDATRTLPFSIYRQVTPLYLKPELAVIAQLPRWGLTADDIQHIIISHFHADHIAGLRDFPSARFIASQSAYDDISKRRGIRALSRAFIPDLLPTDFQQRLDAISTFNGPELPGLGPTYDLFGDGSLQLMLLPGHARGQMGLLAQTERGPVLFAADGCWLRQAIRERRPPSGIVTLFVDDIKAVHDTIEQLYIFSQALPNVNIIPCHCPEAFQQEMEQSHGIN